MLALVRRYEAKFWPAVAIVVLGMVPWFSIGYRKYYVALALIYAIYGMSQYVVMGLTGLPSLAGSILMATGGYTSASLSRSYSIGVSLVGGVLASAVLGGLISVPGFRTRHLYFAIVTLGLVGLAQPIMLNWRSVTGGPDGLIVDPLTNSQTSSYYLIFFLLVSCLFSVRWLARSALGRSFQSVMLDEIVAATMGVNVRAVKAISFVISGALAGLGGGLLIHYVGFASVSDYGFNLSVQALIIVLVGGITSVWGAVVGALIVQFVIPVGLSQYASYQLLVYGAILVVSLFIIPSGIMGLVESARHRLGRGSGSASVPPVSDPAMENVREIHSGHGQELGDDVLEVGAVSKAFGGIVALSDVSLSLSFGTIHGLIGPNGSGKTTLMNLICGVYRLDSGRVVLRGRDISGWSIHRRARAGISRTFQNVGLFERMTVIDNLLVGSDAYRRHTAAKGWRPRRWSMRRDAGEGRRRAEGFLASFGLSAYRDSLVKDLPYGVQKMVEIVRAVLSEPVVLILDEPCAGLNDEEARLLVEFLQRLRESRQTILVVEHNIEFVAAVADTISVLDRGLVIAHGAPSVVLASAAVAEAYFGDEYESGALMLESGVGDGSGT